MEKFSLISLHFLDCEQIQLPTAPVLTHGKGILLFLCHCAHGKRELNPHVLFQKVLKDRSLSLRFSKSLWELRANGHWNIMKLVNFYSLASLENKPATLWLHVDEFLINAWISGHTMIILNM